MIWNWALGVALLPSDVTNGISLAAAYSKEGRLFIVNRDQLGGFNAGGDNQIPREFAVGEQACSDAITSDVAEGPGLESAVWQSGLLEWKPVRSCFQSASQAVSVSERIAEPGSGCRVAIFLRITRRQYRCVGQWNPEWNCMVNEKSASSQGILHAYDATSVAIELWNRSMSGERDAMATGIGFGVPIVFGGRVIVASANWVDIFGLLQ
jgi:hypothetical protein